MTSSEKGAFSEHPRDLLPIYVEGELAEKDRAAVENHLEQCLECSKELDALKQMVDVFRNDKSVFCPDPWELYEFIERGNDPEGKLAGHLEQCPLCCAEVADYRQTTIQKTLPAEIKNELKKVFPTPAPRGISTEIKSFAGAKDWLSSIFRTPVLAFGTAIAAILVVILLYPRGTVPTFIGVSSENWEQTTFRAIPKSLFSEAHARKETAETASSVGRRTSKSSFFEAPKPRVVSVILFQGLNKPLPQSIVNSLYEQLRPDSELEKNFQFSAPAELKQFLDKVADRHLSPTQVLSEFYKEYSINFALIENVKADKDKFGLRSQVIDTQNGQILAESVQEGLSGAELDSRVNDSVALLNKLKTANRNK
jgi:anti-sigma factor RsiW